MIKLLTLLLTASLYVAAAGAQTIRIDEPEFSGAMVFVNDSIGAGIKLEQQACFMSTKSNAAKWVPFANAKITSQSVVKGCCSSVPISSRDKVNFIIRVKDNGVDPASVINIFRLASEKDTRVVELAKSTTYGGTQANEIQFLTFSAKKYGTSSYLIELVNVQPGEYAITLPERRDLFNMFSIQEKK